MRQFYYSVIRALTSHRHDYTLVLSGVWSFGRRQRKNSTTVGSTLRVVEDTKYQARVRSSRELLGEWECRRRLGGASSYVSQKCIFVRANTLLQVKIIGISFLIEVFWMSPEQFRNPQILLLTSSYFLLWINMACKSQVHWPSQSWAKSLQEKVCRQYSERADDGLRGKGPSISFISRISMMSDDVRVATVRTRCFNPIIDEPWINKSWHL